MQNATSVTSMNIRTRNMGVYLPEAPSSVTWNALPGTSVMSLSPMIFLNQITIALFSGSSSSSSSPIHVM